MYSIRDESVRSTSVKSKCQELWDKETFAVHTKNITSQRQYFVARCLTSRDSNVFSLRSTCGFSFYRKLVT